jgi:diguanylate cyclase (GGDEF)-like protein
MLDIDDFKNYNDAFGHEAGNAVLRVLAGILRRSVRADDLVARYGGEEFVVLLGGRLDEIEEAMERIRLQVEDRCSPLDGSPVRRQVTVSAGVAALTDRVQTLEELIEAADEAMYQAKRAGKNRVAGAAEEAA